MRTSIVVATAVFLAVLPALPSAAQTAATPGSLASQYAQSMQAKDYAGALAAAQQLVALNAAAENLRLLADAQLYTGASADALATYDRAIAQSANEKPPAGQDAAWKESVSKIWIGKGNAQLKLKHTPEAVAAYDQAATYAANPGHAYFNACATLYNVGDIHGSAPECRKSVQADPTLENAWFVLGSDLFAEAPIVGGKAVVSAETRQALEKYLELAPNGPHAADTKAMLDAAGK